MSALDNPFSIVAVHGLASNPMTAFLSRGSSNKEQPNVSQRAMWLRDFLPTEGLNARVMTYSHDSAWESGALRKTLYDHGDDFLRALRTKRLEPGVRSFLSGIALC